VAAAYKSRVGDHHSRERIMHGLKPAFRRLLVLVAAAAVPVVVGAAPAGGPAPGFTR